MGEEVAQHHKDIAPLLATSGNHRLQAGIYRCPMVGAKTAAHFLLDFSQAQVSFGLVVGEQDTLPPHRGRFFGKPLRAISRFSHQDAQPPPSPLVGEGGWGDEGERRTGMQNIAHLSQKLYP